MTLSPRALWLELRDATLYVILRSMLWVASWIPRRSATFLAHGLGRLVFLLARRRRSIVMRNLDIAYGEASDQSLHPETEMTLRRRHEIGLGAFQHLIEVALGLATRDRRLGAKEIEREFRCPPEDSTLLDECASGKLAVLAAHVGDWEMSHHYLALRGIPVHVVTRDLSNRHLNRTLSRIRSRHGARVIPKHGALRTLSRALRDGHTVGLLADQNCPSRERFFPFFGVPASTYTHHAKLFVKRGCRVIFIACIREGTRGPFRVTVRDLSSGLPERAHWTARERHQHQADELIRRYLRVTEEIIRENPQQYLWMHRRWKSRPTGEPWLYHDLGQPLPAKIRQASATAASE